MDWGVGRHEIFAELLLPAAVAVVRAASLKRGERVLDLGCGTGNAALLAAEQGALVKGVDPAERLLEVARMRAGNAGYEIDYLAGDAASLPLENACIDVVVSVFAVIFAPDARAAAEEMARVLVSDGRIVLTAWVPGGALMEMRSVVAESVRQALGDPARSEAFAWHDSEALSALFAPYGFRVALEEHRLAFTAPSAREFLERETREHPLTVSSLAKLEPLGQGAALRERMLEILQRGNEDPDGFRITRRYIVATARRQT
jgi:ubiquinone/menaquinone biosynthesis C-methylase UbiE